MVGTLVSVAPAPPFACIQGKVLVVDDEFLIAEMLSEIVLEMGMEVVGTAATADRAVALALRHAPDIVLMDVRLRGERDGIDAALAIRHALGCPAIFITGSAEPPTVARMRAADPAAILIKPIMTHQLRSALVAALAQQEPDLNAA